MRKQKDFSLRLIQVKEYMDTCKDETPFAIPEKPFLAFQNKRYRDKGI